MFEDLEPNLEMSQGFNSSYYRDLIDKSEGKIEPIVDDQSSSETQPIDPEVVIPEPSKVDDPWRDSDREGGMLLKKGSGKGFSKDVDRMLTIQPTNNVAATFEQLFRDLNDKYGLQVKFDFNSFSNTLGYIIEPTNQKAVEVYLSEAYGRVRMVLYGMYLNAIGLLSSQILDPRFIQSNSMSYQDKLVLMRELFDYIKSLNEIYEQVKVDNGEVKLRKLGDDSGKGNSQYNDPEVQNFLQSLADAVKSRNN
jgi:hypothetical protein